MQQQEIIEDGELFSALTSHIAGGMIRVPALFGKPPAPLFTLRKHVEWFPDHVRIEQGLFDGYVGRSKAAFGLIPGWHDREFKAAPEDLVA